MNPRAVAKAAALLSGSGSDQAQTAADEYAAMAFKSEATRDIEQGAAMKAAGVRPGMGVDHFSLGSLDWDLVFTDVAPCRVVDTRIPGGPIALGSC